MSVSYKVTNEDTLEVSIKDSNSSSRSYEFRDLTPRDLKWLDNVLNDADYSDTLAFLVELSNKLQIRGPDLEEESWTNYRKILEILGDQILSQRIKYYDFLEFAFAAGKKSFSCLNELMDMGMTDIWDLIHTMETYYGKEEQAMAESRGVVR